MKEGWRRREREEGERKRAGTLPKAGCNQEGIKKGPAKRERSAYTTDKANKAAEGVA